MNEKFPYKIGQPTEVFFDGEWRKGKIVAGYRYMDGIVTIQLENGRRTWVGESRKDLYRPLVD